MSHIFLLLLALSLFRAATGRAFAESFEGADFHGVVLGTIAIAVDSSRLVTWLRKRAKEA